MNFALINIAHAEGSTEAVTEVAHQSKTEEAHSSGLSIDPALIGFQVLNFLILVFLLKAILYKPLLKLLKERAHKIKQGVEHAERAEILLQESTASREKMLKETRAETQTLLETARKNGEQIRGDILNKAQEEAQKIIVSGKDVVESEKTKALQEIKVQAVELVMQATEKVLRTKMTAAKDIALINDSLNSLVK